MSAIRLVYRWGKRVAVAAIVTAAFFYLALIVLRFEPMVIVTGSMQKTIPVGSLVVDQKVAPRQLEVGDVISFQKPIGAKGIDTHRIVAIKNDHGKRLYQTKGDSNPIADPWVITFDRGMVARYRRGGLYHLLVVSGLHVALAAGLVLGGLRRARVAGKDRSPRDVSTQRTGLQDHGRTLPAGVG